MKAWHISVQPVVVAEVKQSLQSFLLANKSTRHLENYRNYLHKTINSRIFCQRGLCAQLGVIIDGSIVRRVVVECVVQKYPRIPSAVLVQELGIMEVEEFLGEIAPHMGYSPTEADAKASAYQARVNAIQVLLELLTEELQRGSCASGRIGLVGITDEQGH